MPLDAVQRLEQPVGEHAVDQGVKVRPALVAAPGVPIAQAVRLKGLRRRLGKGAWLKGLGIFAAGGLDEQMLIYIVRPAVELLQLGRQKVRDRQLQVLLGKGRLELRSLSRGRAGRGRARRSRPAAGERPRQQQGAQEDR